MIIKSPPVIVQHTYKTPSIFIILSTLNYQVCMTLHISLRCIASCISNSTAKNYCLYFLTQPSTFLLQQYTVLYHKKVTYYRAVGSNFSVVRPTQLQSCVYNKFRVISGHKCKLLCKAQSACMACQGSEGMPPGKFLKNRSSKIEFEGVLGSQSCMLYQLHDNHLNNLIARRTGVMLIDSTSF